jgi:hypothetical protein
MAAAGALGMGVGSAAAGLLLDPFTARQLFNGQVAVFLSCGLLSIAFVVRPLTADR